MSLLFSLVDGGYTLHEVITRLSLIDGIEHRINPGSWTVDINFANADTRSYLMLDDPVFGVLDANRIAF